MRRLLIVAAAGALAACSALQTGGRTSAAGGEAKAASTNMSVSPQMPAAEGTARYGVAKNDNTSVELKVKHLAHPERLQPPASTYVVWLKRTKDAAPQNIGALAVDQDLTGSLDTVTPLHSFELFITAEASSQAEKPSGDALLWSSYTR